MVQSITGQRLEGRYRIIRSIKQGATSEIFEAVQEAGGLLERPVAIKRLIGSGPSDQPRLGALLEEARIVGQLQHANIVSLIDYGVSDGMPFLVLDYVDGIDLADLIELAEKEKKEIPPEVAIHIVTEIAHALAYVHEARDREAKPLGIIHRDVNPNNILISWTGDVRLTDFGIALIEKRWADATAVGTAKGTFSYMAPEQLNGGLVDARTDLFALGCVLHRLIAGYSPMESIDPLTGQISLGIDPGLPPDIAQIVQHATPPKRIERYRDARSMAAECGKALMKRSAGDGRSMLVDWLGKMRPPAPAPVSTAHRIRAWFDERAIRDVIDEPPLERSDSAPTKARADSSEALTRFADQNHIRSSHRGPIPHVGAEDDDVPTKKHELAARPRFSDPSELGAEASAEIVLPPENNPEKTVLDEDTDERGAYQLDPRALTDPAIGAMLHGFRLVELLGSGSTARVYRATHEYLGYSAAVKVAKLDPQTGKAEVRLAREAQRLARIQHPHLVAVFDCGVTPSRAPFLAMELLEGRTLREALQKGARFDPPRVRRLARQIASGLAEAHRLGLVHRDLEPSKIMLLDEATDPKIKILDFGLVREHAVDGPYRSPEQAAGHEVGPGADLYALGVMIGELLAGAPNAGLEALIRSLVEKDPQNRIASANEVLQRLEALEPPTAALAGTQELVTEESSPAETSIIAKSLVAPVSAPVPPRGLMLLWVVIVFVAAALAAILVLYAVDN